MDHGQNLTCGVESKNLLSETLIMPAGVIELYYQKLVDNEKIMGDSND